MVDQRVGSGQTALEYSRVAQLQVMQLFMTMGTEKTGITRRQLTAGTAAAAVASVPFAAQASLGTARVISVSSAGGPRLGLKSYAGTLPLADGEVVLTFDDGPLPATTGSVLDTLARNGVRATFFLIGRNARANPQMVRRIAAEGHTLANHTMTHPWTLRQRSFATGLQDILDGQNAIEQAAGQRIAPFFRFPGFADTPELLAEFSRRNIAVWGTDLWASDWNVMTPDAQLHLLYARVVKARKGIILMHDIRRQTAEMLPSFLAALKQGGFRVVHAVAA
jgi:peptidoglycan/xylan/chitin deacetylase (PgdA/CDA1 family)